MKNNKRETRHCMYPGCHKILIERNRSGYCRAHYISLTSKLYYENKKLKGVCVDCGKPVEVLLCPHCKKPIKEYIRCSNCRKRQMEYDNKYYKKNKEEKEKIIKL